MRDPNKDDLIDIKRWLSRQEVQDGDEIDSKSRDRVHTTMARSIQNTRPLDNGTCNFCGNEREQIVPIPMKVCKKCYNDMIKRSGTVRTMKHHYGNIQCDCCLKRTYYIFEINPKLCQKCMTRLGNVHRRNKENTIKQQQKIQYKNTIARQVA